MHHTRHPARSPSEQGALLVLVMMTASASCTARYTYLVPDAQIAQRHIAEGSFVTLRTAQGDDHDVVVDALRRVSPSVGDATVYAARRTWSPTAGVVSGAFAGALVGALLVGTRCLEGCTEPALATFAGAAVFSLVGAAVGWGVGGLVAMLRTTPQRAAIIYPPE